MAEKKNKLTKIGKIGFGILLIIGGAYSYVWWYKDLITLIKGGLGILIMLIGLLFVAMSLSD